MSEPADLALRPGPLLQRTIVMQGGKPFDYGKEPDWRDQTPHPLCETTRADYPEPRLCAAFVADPSLPFRCHLGHPANCRWLVRQWGWEWLTALDGPDT